MHTFNIDMIVSFDSPSPPPPPQMPSFLLEEMLSQAASPDKLPAVDLSRLCLYASPTPDALAPIPPPSVSPLIRRPFRVASTADRWAFQKTPRGLSVRLAQTKRSVTS